MHIDTPHNPIYRALVTYSSVATGEIKVKIPSLIGIDSEVSVSYIGRDNQSGTWYVPSIGEQIIVTADDHNLTNVFWLQTDPGVLTAVDGFYGAFSDYTDQYAGGAYDLITAQANTAAPMRFTTTDEAFGVSILDSSKILFEHPGVYNLQWSGQFENTNNAPHDVSVWLRKNGGPAGVVGSNGKISMAARKNATEFAHTLAGWNFVFTVVAGDYYEFMWSTDSTLVSIQTYPISTVPTRPSTASLVLTVTPVSKIQIGIPVPDTTPGAGGAEYLDELLDVTLTSPTTNQILIFNGTQWVNNSSLLAAKAPVNNPTFTGTVVLPSNTVTTEMLATALQALLVPTGSISAYAGTLAPPGWLLCNGQSTSGYTALAAVVGANVPDLRGRVIAGVDNMGGISANRLTSTTIVGGGDSVGEVGGAQTHTLDITQIPSVAAKDHTHGRGTFAVDDHGHGPGTFAAAIGATNSNANRIGYIAGTVNGPSTATYSIEAGGLIAGTAPMNHYTPVYGSSGGSTPNVNGTSGSTSANAGGGLEHNNVQPTMVLNYIIKT